MKMGLWCDMMIRCVVFCRVWDLVWLWGLFLSNAECYTRLKQIPKMGMWSVSAVWVRLIDYVGLWDLYCDPLWHDNVIWFCLLWDVWLSGLWWSGLILYSLGYIWVGCWNVFFYVCQSGSHSRPTQPEATPETITQKRSGMFQPLLCHSIPSM